MEAIPILVFIAPSWIVAALFYWLSMRPHQQSPAMAVLNTNLHKSGLYWSNSERNFKEAGPGAAAEAAAHDTAKARRQFWIMTTLLSLMSLLGMFLLMAIFMSGLPRLERNTFASRLATDPNLSAAEVTGLVEELKALI
jgi:hypothetical protein